MKADVQSISSGGHGVAFQHSGAATAVAQTALPGIKIQDDFRTWPQFMGVTRSGQITRGEVEGADSDGLILGHNEQPLS
jgi:hypothetical protein